ASFLSQNLGGLLRDRARAERVEVRRHQSWLLLPADPGVLCWTFVLWPVLSLFGLAYLVLFATNVLHFLLSASRRWRELGKGATSCPPSTVPPRPSPRSSPLTVAPSCCDEHCARSPTSSTPVRSRSWWCSIRARSTRSRICSPTCRPRSRCV